MKPVQFPQIADAVLTLSLQQIDRPYMMTFITRDGLDLTVNMEWDYEEDVIHHIREMLEE